MAAAALAGLSLSSAGCGSGSGAAGDKGPTTHPAAAEETVFGAVAPLAPAAIREEFAKHLGRVVLVDIWATWCPPCREAFPEIVRLHRDYVPGGLVVVSVNWDAPEDVALAEAFVKQAGAPFRSFLMTGDPQKAVEVIGHGWGGAVPCILLFDRAGRHRATLEGEHPIAHIEAEVKRLLAESP